MSRFSSRRIDGSLRLSARSPHLFDPDPGDVLQSRYRHSLIHPLCERLLYRPICLSIMFDQGAAIQEVELNRERAHTPDFSCSKGSK